MAGKFALIIRNSHYEDSSLGRLTASDVDVQALEAVLKAPDVGQFDEVTTLLNEGCATVRKAIARFYDQRQRDDLVFLYFSGQGVKDEMGHLYLALRDTESGLLAGSAIETAFITARMDRSFSKRQVLVLDCCYSGAVAHGAKSAQGVSVGTAEAFEGTGLGRVVLTATDSTQYAWEGDRVIGDAQNSLFTHFLTEGLKTGAADKDADGVITVDELYDYVREQVVTTTPLQTPYKWSYLQRGAIVLAQNPFAKRFVLPAEIEEAVNSKLSGLRLEAVGHLEELLHGHHAGRAQVVLEALKVLSQDDSRKVANAAARALKTHDEETSREASQQAPDEEEPVDDRDPGRPSDIFISYAHEDHAKARALANVLAARGWKVWWDRKIAPGEAYDVVIERELGNCKCAIVLWSTSSVHATWVRNEARRAARRKVLMPILIDAVEMPLEFENLPAADLTSWESAEEHPDLEWVFERVQALSPIPHRRVDEDVQFSVYRPTVVVPQRWYPMLAFAHLAKPRPDAGVDEPDPVAEVQRQAEQILGAAAAEFGRVSMDSRQPIPLEGHLRIVPTVPGVQFNPPERSFLWLEPVHREEFHLRAGLDMDGQTARGSVGVYLDWLLIADIAIAISVDSHARETARLEPDIARPYRRIFASYSHRDAAVVRQFEDYARGFGDRYMTDVIDLRAGEEWDTRLTELIESADVFQLFWSWNSMSSPFVRSEWEHALKVDRAYFIRPVYWEQPFPERGDLPPAALRTLHFAHVGPSLGGVQSPSVQAPHETPPADTLQRGAETEAKPLEAELLAEAETRRAAGERIRQQDAARRAALEIEESSKRLHAEAQQAQERARREYAERRATEEETLKRRAQAEAERAAARRIPQEDANRRATAEEDELKRRLKLESRRAAESNEVRQRTYPDRTSAPKLKESVPMPMPSPSPATAASRSPTSLRAAWWAASVLIFAALFTVVLIKSC